MSIIHTDHQSFLPGLSHQGVFVLGPVFYIQRVLMSCASPREVAELAQLQGDLTPANASAEAWLLSCQDPIYWI